MNEVHNEQHVLLNVAAIREDFPILRQVVNNQALVYFDNAATTQKPEQVLSAMTHYYHHENANIHRGVHTLSVRATDKYEKVRHQVKQFINAKHSHEIIFTRGTTDAINLIAQTFSHQLRADDEIILTEMEHHSNIVPWQVVSERTGAKIKIVAINDAGELDLDVYSSLITAKTKIVAVAHISNAIGTINPIETIIDIAHSKNVPVLIDGAQAVAHQAVDVQKLNCDFYVFSGHKMYAPTGTGILYGKTKWLEQLPPYQCGGDMISEVSFERTRYNKLPYKFEAGTPNIAGVVGLGAAIDYLNSFDRSALYEHEVMLQNYALELLTQIEGIKIIGNAKEKAPVISFVIDGIHPHDIGTVLDHEGIAIRAGHHCAMPLMTRYKVPATARISFGIYNTFEEIDRLIVAIRKLKKLFE